MIMHADLGDAANWSFSHGHAIAEFELNTPYGGGIVLVERKGRSKGRITLTTDMMAHLGIRRGDRILVSPQADGSIILKVTEHNDAPDR